MKEIKNLWKEIIKLKAFLVETKHKSSVLPDPCPSHNQTEAVTEAAIDDPIPPSTDDNASIASVEEFIDDIYIDPRPSSSLQLNCQDLTIQLA